MNITHGLIGANAPHINVTISTSDVCPIEWSVEVGEIWTLDVILLNMFTYFLLISACCLLGYFVYNSLHSKKEPQ